MYKNWDAMLEMIEDFVSFNPCFNGSMYKNIAGSAERLSKTYVSILVLMDLCIKTIVGIILAYLKIPFQSLF